MKLYEKTLHQLRDLLRRREVSAVEVAESVLARVEQTESHVGAYLTVEADRAMEAAKGADRRLADGDAHALTGIPVGVKDNISTRDVKTTAGSRMLAHYVPPYDATVVSRLKEADAPMVGKLNMDEFAMGSTTETSAFQLTRNPYDTTRTPGGSSGGSGAAVAVGSAVFSLGTDTGGSVRLPAAHCGLVGVKPTYGRISRYGVLPMAPSFDVVGPLTKDVRDAAIVLQALSGKDEKDGTGIDADVPDYEAYLGQSIDGLVVGVPEQWLEGVAPDVLDKVKKAIDVLVSLGADVRQVSLPHLAEATAMYRVLVSAEVSSVMARYDGVRFGLRAEGEGDVYSMFAESRGQGFGEEVKRRILRGTYALTGDNFQKMYVAAQKARALLKRDFDRVFEEVALLVSPTAARVAPKLSGEAGTEDDAVQYTDMLTVPMNLTGVPALSMPCGTTEGGLPIGLQLTAPAMQEGTLLQAAFALEEALGLGVLRPEL